MRVLCIDDDEGLRGSVKAGLQQAGLAVDCVANAEDGISAMAAVGYDAVILELSLPDLDGLALLKRLRSAGNAVPVLVLSGRNKTAERILGLEAGADDYLPKPFELRELVARVRALLRRSSHMVPVELVCANLAFRPETHTAVVDGSGHFLPRREAAILEQLLRNAGRPVSKSVMEDRLYAFGEEVASNAIEVHIHFLRKRLAAMAANVRIQTIRGTGYVLSAADAAPGASAGFRSAPALDALRGRAALQRRAGEIAHGGQGACGCGRRPRPPAPGIAAADAEIQLRRGGHGREALEILDLPDSTTRLLPGGRAGTVRFDGAEATARASRLEDAAGDR